MFSARLLDHFANPRHVGELLPPAHRVEVSNPACGDWLRLTARVEAARIVQARFLVRGCTASIAAGSALAEWLTGRSTAELNQFTTELIEQALDGLPATSKHAAVLCVDAVHALLRAAKTRENP